MAEEYVFATRNLSVGYRGKALIHGIEMRLKPGQILTLIGALKLIKIAKGWGVL